jgi:hypothetical protein
MASNFCININYHQEQSNIKDSAEKDWGKVEK